MSDKTPNHAKETVTASPRVGAAIELQPGTIILERFRVVNLLGSGGMGSVYRVKHIHLNKMYALKCINKSNISDVDWRRFEVEAKAANRLDHPNLVKVHDSGLLPEGLPYFVMDLVEGKTLADVMKVHGILPVAQALKIFVQVGFALSYAHQKGVIHRDIKPSNIMIIGDREGTLTNAVKVVDFGLAKITGVDGFNQQTLTKTGEIFGSPLYMSPEQCMGVAVDHRSDLYSFGCVIYETLTGAPPLIGDSALSTMMKHQSEKPLSLKEASLGVDYPRQLESLVERLLEKDPGDRFQDATTLTAELVSIEQHLKDGSATFAKHIVAPGPAPANFSGGGQFNWLGMLSGFVLGLGAGYLLARPHTVVVEQKDPPVNIKFPEKEHPKDWEQYRLSDAEVRNLKPFSEISESKVRIFHFPKYSIGSLYTNGKSMRANGVVNVSNFTPFWFKGNELLWNQPELLKRFRKDEIKRFDLETCDVNLTKLLNYASDITSITELAVDDTEMNDALLPIVDKFPNLTALSVKRTNITGAGIVKLKCLKKLKYLNIDYCQNLKPFYKQCKDLPALEGLGLSRVNLTSEDIEEIGKAKSLLALTLNSNHKIDDETMRKLSRFKNLRAISIVDCGVTSQSIATLKMFPALNTLCVPDWSVKDIQRCKTELPHVTVSGARTRTIRDERSYEEDLQSQGRSKSGWGADP